MAELPGWTPFDPDAPPSLPDLEDGPGRIVAVVATYVATTLGWAGRVAADLASGWSARGHRVVLADAGLVEPQLHEVFGAANAEGLTDAALFGASVRRIARPVRDGSYFLVSAGTPVADPEAALRSPRWTRLCESFRRAGVTLVVFVSPDEPGRAWALEVASDVVVLAGPGEDVRSLLNGAAEAVRGVLGVQAEPLAEAPVESAAAPAEAPSVGPHPPDEPVPEPSLVPEPSFPEVAPAGGPPPADAEVAARRAPGEELPAWTEAAREQQATAGERPDDDADVGDAAERAPRARAAARRDSAARPSKPREGGRRNVTLLMLLLVLLAIVVAAALGLIEVPGLSPVSQGAPGPDEDLGVVATSVSVRETTPPLAYSVVLGAFQDPGVARTRGGQLVSGAGTFVATAPVVVNGTVYHRLLAGPARDSAEAVSLMARVRGTTGLDAQDVAVRRTPLAFRLGETDRIETAARRAQELQALEIPAYVLAVEYENGAVRYRIYAGAYSDEGEAEYLSARLAERGLGGALLSHRTGRVPE